MINLQNRKKNWFQFVYFRWFVIYCIIIVLQTNSKEGMYLKKKKPRQCINYKFVLKNITQLCFKYIWIIILFISKILILTVGDGHREFNLPHPLPLYLLICYSIHLSKIETFQLPSYIRYHNLLTFFYFFDKETVPKTSMYNMNLTYI